MRDLINKITQGNCLEVLDRVADNSIDMVLCDLPYGTTQNKWDSVIDLEQLWKGWKRVCKPNAAIVLTAAQPFTSVLVMSNLRDFKYEWIWQKVQATGFLNAKKQPLRCHESILVFYRKQTTYVPQFTEGTPYTMIRKAETVSSNYGTQYPSSIVNEGKRCPITVIKFAGDKNKLHPTQKPLALFEYLISTYTVPGQLVLDNCVGSGTTAVAAQNLCRSFIAIEQDKKYVAIAKKRLKGTT